SFNAQVSQSGNKYRAAYTNASGTVNTTAAGLTVLPATLFITANDKSMPFGGTPPALNATIGDATYGAVLRNGDTAASLTGTLTCGTSPKITSTTATGTYTITCSGLTSSSYTITYKTGTMTVEPAVQNIH